MYWIKDKPGSGKSTLLKYAYKHARSTEILTVGDHPKVRATFFFHDRGSEKEKSFSGLLHGILHQILRQERGLMLAVFAIYKRVQRLRADTWAEEDLRQAFNKILDQKTLVLDVCLFIDALDEYSGKHEIIANFLKRAVRSRSGTGTRLRICFSSRPLNIFIYEFDNVSGFWLQDQTMHDISRVVWDRMENNTRMKRYLTSTSIEQAQCLDFANAICSKAQGVFLSVRLTLDDLLEQWTAGENIEELLSRLSTLPADLEEFYTRILGQIPRR